MNTRADEIKIEAPNLLESLPNEMQAEVMTYLVPHESQVADVSSSLYSVFHSVDQRYWRDKFKRHFPHSYREANKKADIDWLVEFKETEDKEYKDLSPRMRNLFHLVKEGDADGLRELQVTYEEIYMASDSSRQTLAVWATRSRMQTVLDYFYSATLRDFIIPENGEVDVLKRDKYGLTVLNNAVTFRQSRDTIIGLIAQGSDVNSRTAAGASPLYNAAFFGWVELTEVLLANRADINLSDINRVTPMFAAAQEGKLDVVNILLKHGADCEWTNKNGVAPIFIASHKGRVDVVKRLIEHGANINAACHRGGTALFIACQNGDKEIVKYLLANDAIYINSVYRSNEIALIAFAKEYSIDVQSRMLTFIHDQPDPVIRMRPIDIARVMGHEDIVGLLQKKEEELQKKAEELQKRQALTPS